MIEEAVDEGEDGGDKEDGQNSDDEDDLDVQSIITHQPGSILLLVEEKFTARLQEPIDFNEIYVEDLDNKDALVVIAQQEE